MSGSPHDRMFRNGSRRAAGSRRSTSLGLACVLALSACQSVPPRPPPDSVGWRIRQGQAVWTPRQGASDLAGDLSVATKNPGEYLLEFSKPAMPLVRIERSPAGWEVHAPGGRHHSGRRTPPDRSWFRLAALLAGENPPPPWKAEVQTDSTGSTWVLEHPRTGERIEGFLGP